MSAQGHRIVFLYSELAGYFLACAEALGQHPEVASVDIAHWPIHPEAPFQFESTDHFTLHPKEKHRRESLKQLATALYQLLRKSEQELIDMGKKGHQIGSETTPQRWAKTLLNLVSL